MKWCRRGEAKKDAELDFGLPYYGKFLLLAAFICSRNPATTDRRMFDITDTSKQKLRGGHKALEKKVTARQLCLMLLESVWQ